jgi:hypothetical protein
MVAVTWTDVFQGLLMLVVVLGTGSGFYGGRTPRAHATGDRGRPELGRVEHAGRELPRILRDLGDGDS